MRRNQLGRYLGNDVNYLTPVEPLADNVVPRGGFISFMQYMK